MNTINVLMIDNKSMISAVRNYFSSLGSTNVNIKYYENDGMNAVKIIESNKNDVDVILMDTILPTLDGIGVLKYLKNHKIDKKVIIYSYFNNDSMIKNIVDFDITFFLNKNISFEILEERINDAYNLSIKDNYNGDMSKYISKLLHNLGMPSHIKGYQYIRDSIELMYSNPDSLSGITKNIYPYIANKYNTTSSRVERAIRHAIEVSWSRGDYDLMEEIFGHSVDFDRAKPTNSEFLATITDKILLDRQ